MTEADAALVTRLLREASLTGTGREAAARIEELSAALNAARRAVTRLVPPPPSLEIIEIIMRSYGWSRAAFTSKLGGSTYNVDLDALAEPSALPPGERTP